MDRWRQRRARGIMQPTGQPYNYKNDADVTHMIAICGSNAQNARNGYIRTGLPCKQPGLNDSSINVSIV